MQPHRRSSSSPLEDKRGGTLIDRRAFFEDLRRRRKAALQSERPLRRSVDQEPDILSHWPAPRLLDRTETVRILIPQIPIRWDRAILLTRELSDENGDMTFLLPLPAPQDERNNARYCAFFLARGWSEFTDHEDPQPRSYLWNFHRRTESLLNLFDEILESECAALWYDRWLEGCFAVVYREESPPCDLDVAQ